MIEPYLDWQSKVCNQTIVDCETCSSILDFNVAMCDLRRKNNILYDYLAEINPLHWARAHFPVSRFGHVTSNIQKA